VALYRLYVHGADRGLFDARSPDAARRLAERVAKLAAGETEVEFRVSAVGLKLSPRQHDALLAIVREYQAAIDAVCAFPREHAGLVEAAAALLIGWSVGWDTEGRHISPRHASALRPPPVLRRLAAVWSVLVAYGTEPNPRPRMP
jgi:hypothetical protein